MKKQNSCGVKRSKGVLLVVAHFLVSSASLFLFVNMFFSSPALASHCPSAGYDEVRGVCIPNTTGLSTTPVATILKSVMNWLLAVLGFIAIIGFAISGIQYLMAAGDEKTIETAKTNMKYSIIGVVVALSGFILITAIDSLLNGSSSF